MYSLRFHHKKRLGQSFLIDKNIIKKIILATSLSQDDTVLEIGPGRGILTRGLASNVKEIIAVELDKKLYQSLSEGLGEFNNIRLINQDILKFNLKKLVREQRIRNKLKIVANIPYSITSLILEYIFKNFEFFSDVYLMVQKEFALRLVARPNTKDYSSVTCFVHFYADPTLLFSVRRTCFRPQPKVDSSFIRLNPKSRDFWSNELDPKNKTLLFKIIHSAFNQRRKNILNSLAIISDKKKISQILSRLNIDWRSRAENLSIHDYVRISKEID